MCPAIHINSRSWLRSSSTHEPSDPPLRVFFCLIRSSPGSRLLPWEKADQHTKKVVRKKKEKNNARATRAGHADLRPREWNASPRPGGRQTREDHPTPRTSSLSLAKHQCSPQHRAPGRKRGLNRGPPSLLPSEPSVELGTLTGSKMVPSLPSIGTGPSSLHPACSAGSGRLSARRSGTPPDPSRPLLPLAGRSKRLYLVLAKVCHSLPLGWKKQVSIMILPQVHLRKPCYDFYFL